jgi:hypothetical protein
VRVDRVIAGASAEAVIAVAAGDRRAPGEDGEDVAGRVAGQDDRSIRASRRRVDGVGGDVLHVTQHVVVLARDAVVGDPVKSGGRPVWISTSPSS